MLIKIELFPPFLNVVGKKKVLLEINNSENGVINFHILLVELIKQYPKMQSLLPTKLNDQSIHANCFPVREEKILFMMDEIYHNDVIKIYGSLSGG